MSRDENIFPQPEVFRPERYEALSNNKEKTALEYGQDDPSAFVFGFGRRCVLVHLIRVLRTADLPCCLLSVSNDNVELAPAKHSQSPRSSTRLHAFLQRLT